MSDDLPAGWIAATLGQVVGRPRAKAAPSAHPELPFVGMDSIAPGGMDLLSVGRFGDMKSAGGVFEPGDVLYGRMRPYLNKVHLAKQRGACSAEFIVVPPGPAVRGDYLAYLIHQRAFVNFASEQSSGDRPRVDFEGLASFGFGLPPIDEGERALERVGQLVERYRQSVLKAAVTGELTREWRESTAATPWSRAEISAIGTVTTGNTPPTSDAANYGPGLPFLKPTDLDQGYTVTEYRQTLTDQGVQYCRPLKAQAVLVTCIGATIGKLGLARMACATNQQINAVEVDNSRMRAKFLYWCLASPEGQRAIIGGASATTLPILNKSRFQAITVPVPGLVEQDMIVDLIERHIGQAERSTAAAAAERRRLHALRQSILKAAFSGQLIPQDPRDEPASALLARLAAQAAEAPAAAQRRGRSAGRRSTRPNPEPVD